MIGKRQTRRRFNWNLVPSVAFRGSARSCSSYGAPGYKANGIVFYGNKGTIDYDGSGTYMVYDLDNKALKTIGEDPSKKSDLAHGADPGLNDTHALNFIESIRANTKLNAPIEQGYTSTVLGLLGNIAQRVGHELQIDPKNGHILGDRKAARLWTREYAPG
jgi:hypothetical protein